jgi:hypothetical protein
VKLSIGKIRGVLSCFEGYFLQPFDFQKFSWMSNWEPFTPSLPGSRGDPVGVASGEFLPLPRLKARLSLLSAVLRTSLITHKDCSTACTKSIRGNRFPEKWGNSWENPPIRENRLPIRKGGLRGTRRRTNHGTIRKGEPF